MGPWWPPGHVLGWEHTFVHTVFDLLEALRKGTIPKPNFADGVANQQVMEAMERSSKGRRWVNV